MDYISRRYLPIGDRSSKVLEFFGPISPAPIIPPDVIEKQRACAHRRLTKPQADVGGLIDYMCADCGLRVEVDDDVVLCRSESSTGA